MSDAERQGVVDLLCRHTAAGRLDLDELADRAAEAYAARTAADLARALRQLPPPPEVAAAGSAGRRDGIRQRALVLGALDVACMLLWVLTGAGHLVWPAWVILVTAVVLSLEAMHDVETRRAARRNAQPRGPQLRGPQLRGPQLRAR